MPAGSSGDYRDFVSMFWRKTDNSAEQYTEDYQ